jgi:hypothetical protein
MTIDSWWLAPLAVAGVGAVVLSVATGLVTREVSRLQKSMRPLRINRRRPSR